MEYKQLKDVLEKRIVDCDYVIQRMEGSGYLHKFMGYFGTMPHDMPEDYFYKEDREGNLYLYTNIRVKALDRQEVVMTFYKGLLNDKSFKMSVNDKYAKLRHKLSKTLKKLKQ